MTPIVRQLGPGGRYLGQARIGSWVMRLDPELQQLVSIWNNVNVEGAGYGLTVMTGGLVVSGHLISISEWYRLTALAIRNSASPTMADIYEASREQQLFEIKVQEAADEAVQRATEDMPVDHLRATLREAIRPSANFIHLRDAWIFGAGSNPLPTDRKLLWRANLEAISGWNIGVFGPAS